MLGDFYLFFTNIFCDAYIFAIARFQFKNRGKMFLCA